MSSMHVKIFPLFAEVVVHTGNNFLRIFFWFHTSPQERISINNSKYKGKLSSAINTDTAYLEQWPCGRLWRTSNYSIEDLKEGKLKKDMFDLETDDFNEKQ